MRRLKSYERKEREEKNRARLQRKGEEQMKKEIRERVRVKEEQREIESEAGN